MAEALLKKKRKILPRDAIQLAAPETSAMQVCLLSAFTAHPVLVSIHYPRTKITLKRVSQISSATRSHRCHLGSRAPLLDAHTLPVLSKHQAALEAMLSVTATHSHSSNTAPKTSPALGSRQPSSISDAFLKRKRCRLTKFRSPYTAPQSRSPGGSEQPSAACSDPKTQRGFREPNSSFTREVECGIFLTSG